MNLRSFVPAALRTAGVLSCLAWSGAASAGSGEHLLMVDPFSANPACTIDNSGDIYFVEGRGYDIWNNIVCETTVGLYPYSATFSTGGSNCPSSAVTFTVNIVLRNANTMAVVWNAMQSAQTSSWGSYAQVGPFNVPPSSNCPNGTTLSGIALGANP